MITLGYPTMLFNILSTKMIKLTLYACSYKQLSQQSIICLSTLIKPVNTHHFLKHTPSCHHIFITKNNHKKTPTKVSNPYHAYSQHCSNILFPQENDFISYTTDQMTRYCQLMQLHLFICHSKILIEKKNDLYPIIFQ